MSMHEPSAAVAFALGLWAAVQPCPLTANLAAVAWLGRRAVSIRGAVAASLCFVAGQLVAYVGLAWLILTGMAVSWRASMFLQRHISELLGPVWILTGMVLLGLTEFRLPRFFSPLPPREGSGLRAAKPADNEGRARPSPLRQGAGTRLWAAFSLGFTLALAFCPVTAVLFFVNLLTIATTGGSRVIYPALYALGAALPVAVLALLFEAGSRWIGTALNRTQQVQRWLNVVAGWILVVIGVYSCLRFNFGLRLG